MSSMSVHVFCTPVINWDNLSRERVYCSKDREPDNKISSRNPNYIEYILSYWKFGKVFKTDGFLVFCILLNPDYIDLFSYW